MARPDITALRSFDHSTVVIIFDDGKGNKTPLEFPRELAGTLVKRILHAVEAK